MNDPFVLFLADIWEQMQIALDEHNLTAERREILAEAQAMIASLALVAMKLAAIEGAKS